MIGNAKDRKLTSEPPKPISLLMDILRKELGLAADQVFFWHKDFEVPGDLRLYIGVRLGPMKAFSTSRREIPTDDGLTEQLSTNVLMQVMLDVFGRDMDTVVRKEEVLLALKSTYAQQVQEKEGFALAGLPTSFVDLSGLETSAIPYRFNAVVNVKYMVSKTKAIEHYDTFEKEVKTEE